MQAAAQSNCIRFVTSRVHWLRAGSCITGGEGRRDAPMCQALQQHICHARQRHAGPPAAGSSCARATATWGRVHAQQRGPARCDRAAGWLGRGGRWWRAVGRADVRQLRWGLASAHLEALSPPACGASSPCSPPAPPSLPWLCSRPRRHLTRAAFPPLSHRDSQWAQPTTQLRQPWCGQLPCARAAVALRVRAAWPGARRGPGGRAGRQPPPPRVADLHAPPPSPTPRDAPQVKFTVSARPWAGGMGTLRCACATAAPFRIRCPSSPPTRAPRRSRTSVP